MCSWALVICLLQTICVILELVVTGYVILYQSHSQNQAEQCLNIYVKSGPNNWVKRKQSRLESGPLQTTEYPDNNISILCLGTAEMFSVIWTESCISHCSMWDVTDGNCDWKTFIFCVMHVLFFINAVFLFSQIITLSLPALGKHFNFYLH